MTLAESVEEDKDITEEANGVKFVFEKGIAGFVDGKVIDYHDGPRGGFSINDENPSDACGGCTGC